MTNSQKVLLAILAYWQENAIPPTIRNIQKATGISSSSEVRYCYFKLEKSGAIKRIKSKPVPVHIFKLIAKS